MTQAHRGNLSRRYTLTRNSFSWWKLCVWWANKIFNSVKFCHPGWTHHLVSYKRNCCHFVLCTVMDYKITNNLVLKVPVLHYLCGGMLCNKKGLTVMYLLNVHLWTCCLLATAFFMEALRSNISTHISVLSNYLLLRQAAVACNKRYNVHPARCYCKIKMYIIPFLLWS